MLIFQSTRSIYYIYNHTRSIFGRYIDVHTKPGIQSQRQNEHVVENIYFTPARIVSGYYRHHKSNHQHQLIPSHKIS